MASFATPTELATYLQTATEAEATDGNPDVLDTARATLLLNSASAQIREFCGWTITQETVTARRVYPRGAYLFLPTKRLTAFTMTIDGVAAVDGTDFYWEANGPGRVLLSRAIPTSSIVLATWTHGYTVAPDELKESCCERAAAKYVNPSLYRSENLEGTVTVYGATPMDQDDRLRAYRLVGVA